MILQVNNLEKYYGTKKNVVKVLDNISFAVKAGTFMAIMGPSGSGKSTLLNCISTIDKPTSGDVYIEDKKISNVSKSKLEKIRKQDIGFIFQDFSLISTLNGYDNISLSQTISGHKASKEEIVKLAKLLEVDQHLDKYDHQLSGGQKQRVAAVRALVRNPKILFADEPTGALDTKSSTALLDKFTVINQQLGTTIMMVTHDSNIAAYADQVMFIKDGKIFNTISKRDDEGHSSFYKRVNDVQSLLHGESDAV